MNNYEKKKQNAVASVTQKTMIDERLWNACFKSNPNYKDCDFYALDAFDLMILGCYYCGDIALSIDRLDSDEGHTLDNCVGCCVNCNLSKGAIDPKTFVLQSVYRTKLEYPETDDIWYEQKQKPRISDYIRGAEKRGKNFELNTGRFAEMIVDMCAYCKRMPTTFFGIDKIDPTGGYTEENTVTACSSCNWAKWDQSVDEFTSRNVRITERYFAGCFDDMKHVEKNTSRRRLRTGKPRVSGAEHHGSKKIYRYALDGMYVDEYDCVADAAERVGGDVSGISACARGNINYAYAYGFIWRYTKTDRVEPYVDPQKKKVYQYNLDGSYVGEYDSIDEAAEKVGGLTSGISHCASGTINYSSEFVWRYTYTDTVDPVQSQNKKIYRYTLDGTYVDNFSSVEEAAKKVGGNKSNISACALGKNKFKTAYKFKWSYDPPINSRMQVLPCPP